MRNSLFWCLVPLEALCIKSSACRNDNVENIFRLLRRCLLGVFIGYWLILIFYTAEKFVTGGSSVVVGWYMHIDASPVHQGDGWTFTQWRWGTFHMISLSLSSLRVVNPQFS